MHFRTFRLHPPHAPPSSGHTSCSGRAWPPTRFGSLSAGFLASFIFPRLLNRLGADLGCVAGGPRPPAPPTIHFFSVSLPPPAPHPPYFLIPAGSTPPPSEF